VGAGFPVGDGVAPVPLAPVPLAPVLLAPVPLAPVPLAPGLGVADAEPGAGEAE
jgi:hypothetical protein